MVYVVNKAITISIVTTIELESIFKFYPLVAHVQ